MASPVYLDHAATTPVRPEVLEAMHPFFDGRFGNPSSTHRWGREARAALDEARDRLARCMGARSDEIVFTSGGTEADNLAVIGAARLRRADRRTAVVCSAIEHKAVLAAVEAAEREGAEPRILPVTTDGLVDENAFAGAVDEHAAICSVMWVNNEIGTVQPVPRLAELAVRRGVLFHTDAVQAFGKVAIDAASQPFDLLTISGHKIGAAKGIGALFVRRGRKLDPLVHGGGQERGRRPGTENVAMAVGLACAAELTLAEQAATNARLGRLREMLENAIRAGVPDVVVHGARGERVPHIVNVSAPGTDGESLLMALDLAGIACSGGSACQSGSSAPSHVLAALGVPRALASAAIRMSLGRLTTDECVMRAATAFTALVDRARQSENVAS
ncbi:MAG: cysteine desulfurase NifS [Gemmatimonadaceae bacterium]